jgi:hypothetical protein
VRWLALWLVFTGLFYAITVALTFALTRPIQNPRSRMWVPQVSDATTRRRVLLMCAIVAPISAAVFVLRLRALA